MAVKVQHLCTLVCGEVLYQFDLLSEFVEGMNLLTVKTFILGLDAYFFPVNVLSKKKRKKNRRKRKL